MPTEATYSLLEIASHFPHSTGAKAIMAIDIKVDSSWAKLASNWCLFSGKLLFGVVPFEGHLLRYRNSPVCK